MEEKQVLRMKDENGNEIDAELLAAFEMDNKEYAIYSTDVDNEEMSNIYAAELIKNEDGTRDIKEIEDPSIKDKITDMINDIVNK